MQLHMVQQDFGTLTSLLSNSDPLERLLMADPAIGGAVIFSRGPNFGVIIEPDRTYTAHDDTTDETEALKFEELIS